MTSTSQDNKGGTPSDSEEGGVAPTHTKCSCGNPRCQFERMKDQNRKRYITLYRGVTISLCENCNRRLEARKWIEDRTRPGVVDKNDLCLDCATGLMIIESLNHAG